MPCVGEVEAEVARLLGDPGGGGWARAAGQLDAPVRVFDEEEDVVAAQESVSTVKKSQATMLAACARMNSRQPGPDRCGAGPSPRARAADGRRWRTRGRAWPSSPLMRRWPQRGFSRASRSTRARTSAGMGASSRDGGCRDFLRTSADATATASSELPDARRARARQVANRRRKQGAISRTKLRPRHLTPQDHELVTQDEQLDVLDVQTAATPNERAQQGPEREVEK